VWGGRTRSPRHRVHVRPPHHTRCTAPSLKNPNSPTTRKLGNRRPERPYLYQISYLYFKKNFAAFLAPTVYEFLRRTARIRVTLLYTRVYAQSSRDLLPSAVPASPNYLANSSFVESGQRAAFTQLPGRPVTAFALSTAFTPT